MSALFAFGLLTAGCSIAESGDGSSSALGADPSEVEAMTADHRDAGAPGGTELRGYVAAFYSRESSTYAQSNVSASFYGGVATGTPAPTCGPATKVSEACTFTACIESLTTTTDGGAPSAPAALEYLSAGPITVGDSRGSVTLEYSADGGAGTQYGSPSLGYEPVGERLEVHAAGARGGIGPFHVSLEEPTEPAFVFPSVGAAPLDAIYMNPQQDYTLSWTGGSPGSDVAVNLFATRNPGDGFFYSEVVACTFDAGAEQGTIPSKGALDQLPTISATMTAGGALGFLELSTTASKSTHVDGATVTTSIMLWNSTDSHEVYTVLP